MRIEDTFEVPLPPEQAWQVLMDIERIAPCLPGAQLREIDGDTYRGIVKVKVGPITAQYQGSAHFEHRDDASRTARVVASGRETRGQGNASARIELSAAPAPVGTRVSVTTDLSLTGRVAQLGRGALAEVSSKLLAQFVENLAGDLAVPRSDVGTEAPPAAEPGHDAPARSAQPAAVGAPGARSGADGVGSAAEGPRAVSAPEPEPVDLIRVGTPALARRLLPVLAAAVGCWLLVRWIRRRRRPAE